jgi:hypothetical protein
MAVVAGCVLVPSAHLVSKDWGLLVGGLAAGTLALRSQPPLGPLR